LGERFQQTLYLFKKVNGKLKAQALEPTMFVPMTGTAEQQRLVKPDGTRPALRNGSFEDVAQSTGFPAGWYYMRYGKVQADSAAPDGKSAITFSNNVRARGGAAGLCHRWSRSSRSMCRCGSRPPTRQGTSPNELPRFFVGF
jgi:protein-L-isoaspartate(D-aspartate) O-methyltransferase